MSRPESNGSSRHKPRTYAEACAELGDQPWRKLEGTEQWFLADEEPGADDAAAPQATRPDDELPAVTLDTAAFIIPRSGWLPKLGATGWLLVGGVTLTLGLVWAALPNARLIVAASQAPAPTVAAPPVAVAAPRVAVAAPPVAVAAPPVAVAAPPAAIAAPAVQPPHERPLKKASLRDRRARRRHKH